MRWHRLSQYWNIDCDFECVKKKKYSKSQGGGKKWISQINDVVDFYVKTMYNGHGQEWKKVKYFEKESSARNTLAHRKKYITANWYSKNIQPNRDYSIERTKDYQRWIRIVQFIQYLCEGVCVGVYVCSMFSSCFIRLFIRSLTHIIVHWFNWSNNTTAIISTITQTNNHPIFNER